MLEVSTLPQFKLLLVFSVSILTDLTLDWTRAIFICESGDPQIILLPYLLKCFGSQKIIIFSGGQNSRIQKNNYGFNKVTVVEI